MKRNMFRSNNWSFNRNSISCSYNLRSVSIFAWWGCIMFYGVFFLNRVEDFWALGNPNLIYWRRRIFKRSLCSMIVHLLLILNESLSSRLFWRCCSWRVCISKILLLLNVFLQIVSFPSVERWHSLDDLMIAGRHRMKFQGHWRWLVIASDSTNSSSSWITSSDSTFNWRTIFNCLVIRNRDHRSWLVFCLLISSNWHLSRFSSIFVNRW